MHLEVSTTVNGGDALAILRGPGKGADAPARPHVVLLDLRMPRLGGLEVLSAVKGDPVLQRIPICVLTSSDRPDDIDQAYVRGTNAYVVKSQAMNGIRRALAGVSEFWGGLVTLPEPP